VALPLARTASSEEAALVEERLGALGFVVRVVADEALAIESTPPLRIRRLEFTAETLTGYTSAGDEAHVAVWEDVALLVRGRLLKKRIEVEERGTLVRTESALADAREMFDDENVLDLFTSDDGALSHWRIAGDGFDYSCLAERKSLLARDNFVRLLESLREQAARAVYDEEYGRVRHLLAAAWPLSERKESGGLRRERPGKFNAEAVTTLNNETQFTRYARLRYHFVRKSEISSE
jgi:hypothetical protein